MPHAIDELLQLLDLEEIERGLYRGQNPVTQRQRAFGGQVLAQALAAVQRTLEPDRMVHSLHAYFMRPGRTDRPMIYDVETVRDGRAFSTRRVLARQDGRPIFSLTASAQIGEQGLEHADEQPRDVPPPEDCPRMSEVLSRLTGRPADIWEAEWGVLDVRWVGSSRPDAGNLDPGANSALARVWVRANGELPDDERIHQAVLAYASDLTLLSVSTVPHLTTMDSPGVQAASLDHAMWFHRPVRADQWWLYDQVSPSASGARGFAMGRIFAQGRVAATAVQEGLVRITEPKDPGAAQDS